MATDYQVAALWIGGTLSFLEHLCLKSFVDAGQHIRLYTYEGVTNPPAGVELADANDILPPADVLRHSRTGSPALHSDLFRYHLLARCDRTIWADTDAYCLRPFTTPTGHFHAWESRDGVNGGVLGLPRDSETLARLIAFTSDPHAIPDWYGDAYRRELEAKRDAGTPVHAGDMPWGVWGPHALTHFLKQTGEIRHSMPRAALYPFAYHDRNLMLKPSVQEGDYLTGETFSIHFYGRRMRARIVARHDGIPPARSLLGRLLTRHGIDPRDAPIPRKEAADDLADSAPEAATPPLAPALPQADLPDPGLPVRRVADLTGAAPDLLLAAHARWGCAIDLIDLRRDGSLGDGASDWITACRAALTAGGVPAGQVRVVTRGDTPTPAELMFNLKGFGDRYKAAPLLPILAAGLAPGGLLLTDIRKGSGTIPLLRPLGSLTLQADWAGDAVKTTRATLKRSGTMTDTGDGVRAQGTGTWPDLAASLAGPEGFFTTSAEHSFLFVPRDPGTLVVTFDNLDIALDKREDRRPWGFSFIEKQGWSMLGVMAAGWTWFRDPWVTTEFRRLAAEGFFARFGRVVFYGASMGGYGACAFSAACPGAEVVAISPQSTLDRALVPWETRYRTAWSRDFSGPYGDAAVASRTARRVTLLYDPYEPLDARHVARFDGDNVLHLRTPLLGHRLGSSLHQMGLLSQITLGALAGTLTEADFYRLLRARRSFPRYQRELFKRALDRGHPLLARRLARWVLTRGDNRYIRKALADLPPVPAAAE